MLKRLFSLCLSLCLLVGPASATWSIVMVDMSTGEVAVGTATCLAGNIKRLVPVVVVGVGAGAAQSVVDTTGGNRQIIRDGLVAGQTPDEILEELVFGAGTTPGMRQYGISAMSGPSSTHTGGGAGLAKGGVVGQIGSIRYAIQGNLLANVDVLNECEWAVLNHNGDLSQRLMAGMRAAARVGGDGRCSCNGVMPTSCGVPHGFDNSSLIATAIVARIGDTDGPCFANGCAQGSYYLSVNIVATPQTTDDAVIRLQETYNVWRANRIGQPDHIESRASTTTDRLVADGKSTTLVTVRLADLEGTPIEHGGATVEVSSTNGLTDLGPVVDHGDGTYSFLVRAGATAGTEELVVTADGGVQKATLYPHLNLELVDPIQASKGPRTVRRTTARSSR